MWEHGDVVVMRNLCGERCWLAIPVYVVEDTPELCVTYLPEGAPFRYVEGSWPTANGRHPWHPAEAWSGHGVLMLQRPGDPYGVWVFWDGPERAFGCWYLNIQEWSRTADGFTEHDLELDVVVYADGSWRLKDEEFLDQRVAQGRYTVQEMAHARAVAADLTRMVDAGEQWWDESWASWTPPPEWTPPSLPEGWVP